MRRAWLALTCGFAVTVLGCIAFDGPPATPAPAIVPPTASVPPTSTPAVSAAPSLAATPAPTIPPAPTLTALTALPDLDADEFKQGLIDLLAAVCVDGDGSDQRLWTCTHGSEVEISVYGPDPDRVSALRVVSHAPRLVDRRSWLRMYASTFGVEVFQWVDDHFETDESALVGRLWLRMRHEDTWAEVRISIERGEP